MTFRRFIQRLLLVLALPGAIIWGTLRWAGTLVPGKAVTGNAAPSLTEPASPTDPSAPQTPGILPPAPYPGDLWERASRVSGIILSRSSEADLPPTLHWQNGAGQPDIGDPASRKGGCVRLSNAGPFPANFLAFGSPSPQFFHYNCFSRIDIPLVEQHPLTSSIIPGTAAAWAAEGQHLYFRLDPDARYSNGRPLRAADYVLGLLLRAELASRGLEAGDISSAAGEIRAAQEHIREVCVLGDHLLRITMKHPLHELSPCLAATLLHPAEPGFYADFGTDYTERYQQRIPPTTGAYTIGSVQRGRLITLERIHGWWAAAKPYRRFTCNADRIEHHFLTDENQAWEFFLRGKLDVMQTRSPTIWQAKLNTRDVAAGRIERHTFRANYPMPPYGIALNAKRLADPELRRGLLAAMDMPQAIRLLFMGEGEQLSTFTTGYGSLTPTATPRCAFNPAAARAHFARAGYTETGPDGILRTPDGRRLSVRLTYAPSEQLSALASVLTQSARQCGAEIIPDAVPWQLCANRLQQGEHELLFWATLPATPLPDYRRHFSSKATGYDAPFGLTDAALDTAITDYEKATTLAARAAACAHIDRLIADRAIWLPGWKENLVHLACWRHIRFPQTPTCRFSTPTPYDVMEAHLYWVDSTGHAPTGLHPEVDAHHDTTARSYHHP